MSGDSTRIKLPSDRGNAPARLSGPGQASLTLELPAAGAICPFSAYANHLVQFQTLALLSNLGGILFSHPPPANKHGHNPFLNLSLLLNPSSPPASKPIMNGHFAAVGDAPAAEQYDHGVQVIDEDKQYKYVPPLFSHAPDPSRPSGL